MRCEKRAAGLGSFVRGGADEGFGVVPGTGAPGVVCGCFGVEGEIFKGGEEWWGGVGGLVAVLWGERDEDLSSMM